LAEARGPASLSFLAGGHLLARNLDLRQRLRCALHHYRYEQVTFAPSYVDSVYRAEGLELWRHQEDEHVFDIRHGVGNEVDEAVGGVEMHRRVRLAAEEFGDTRGQMELRERDRRADAHGAVPLRARQHQVGLAGRGDQPGTVLVEAAAFLRRRDHAGGA